MKNTKTKHFVNNSLNGMIILMLLFTAACSSLTGSFSRGTVAKGIQEDKRFSSPAAMTIDIRGKLTNAEGKAWQISRDDKAEDAAVRAKTDFAIRQPQLLAAETLGYLKLYFEEPELGEKEMNMPYDLFRQDLGVWYFKVRAELTEKGKGLWRNLNLEVDEKSLPLAMKDSLEITGISDQNQTMKKVDFTYKFKATELGEALDPESSTFAKLPSELQESLKKTQYNGFGGGSSNVLDFKTVRTGVAYFQKYDDGWRLSNLSFL